MDRRMLLSGTLAAVGAGLLVGFRDRWPGSSSAMALSGVPAPAGQRKPGTGPVGAVSIRPVPLGGGGYVTGIDQSADGTRFVCRTDVCNAYVRDADEPGWRPLFSPDSMLPGDFDPLPPRNDKADGQGVAGVRIAPSDSDVIYASYYGYIWRSADGGKSIRRTALAQMAMPSNAGMQRLFNRTIDVHPTDADQLLVSTWGEGTWYSRDGGREWSQVTLPETVPMGKHPGLSLVLFDPETPERIYIFVGGVGLFASTTGASGRFSPIAGGPTRSSTLVPDHRGGIYLCEHTDANAGQVWRYAPDEGWRATKPPHEMRAIAVSPANPQRLFGSNSNGYGMISQDGGATWTAKSMRYSSDGGEVGWIAGLDSLVVAQMQWDAKGGDTVWYAQGVGVLKGDVARERLTDWSAGIEELIAISGLSPPDGKPVLTCWDKPFWRIESDTAYLNRPNYPPDPGQTPVPDIISHGTFLDYASDDPRFLVGVTTVGKSFKTGFGPGFSTDGGASWTRFAGTPAKGWGVGGCIAASTRDNFIILPSNNGFGAWTRDGGQSWNTIRLDGVNDTSEFANAYYVVRKNIAADKTRTGVFALVYKTIQKGDNPFGNPLGGIWVTTDGGQSWRQTRRGVITSGSHDPTQMPRHQDRRQFWRCQLEYVPGHMGELVYTSYADYGDDRLWWSKDDGGTWAELHGSIRAVVSFGFGQPAPGQTRPAVYFWGIVDDVTGLYASFDWFATTPTLLSRHPSPQLANAAWVTGDANRFGRAYLGTGGAGWLIVDVELV